MHEMPVIVFKLQKIKRRTYTNNVIQKLDSLCMLGRSPSVNARKELCVRILLVRIMSMHKLCTLIQLPLINNNNHPHTSRELNCAATSPEVSVSI